MVVPTGMSLPDLVTSHTATIFLALSSSGRAAPAVTTTHTPSTAAHRAFIPHPSEKLRGGRRRTPAGPTRNGGDATDRTRAGNMAGRSRRGTGEEFVHGRHDLGDL